MRALLDSLQGAGLAGAAGLRPFLPALVAGLCATADLGLDFDDTDFAFLEAPWFLALLAALAIAALAVQLRDMVPGPRVQSALSGVGVGLGALLFAGSLDDRFADWWPGLVGGVVAALIAGVAARQLLARTGARLDQGTATTLPLYAEGAAIVLAGAAIALPPLGLLGVLGLGYLYLQGRRREGEKYAGLRILK
jgi:hypothetical protein